MLYKQIAKKLFETIDNGVYKEGEKLPSELDLAKEYNTSKATIRKSLALLVNNGYITARRQSGYYVNSEFIRKSFGSLTLNSLHQIYKKDRLYNKVLLLKKFKADKVVSEKLGIKYLEDVFYGARIRYVDNVAIQLETVYMPCYLFSDLTMEDYQNSVYDYIERKYTIKYSVKTIKAGVLPTEFERYIPEYANKPLLMIYNVSTLESGEVFEYSINYHFDDEFNILTTRR